MTGLQFLVGGSYRHRAARLTATALILLVLLGLAAGGEEEKRAPSFQLTNWDGQQVTLDSLAGKAAIVVFTYARCVYACPMVTGLLRDLDRSMGSPADLRFVHISVTPAEDTAEEVRNHFRKFGIDPERDRRWLFLTGPDEDVASVLRDYGIEVERTPLGDGVLIQHTLRVLVLNRTGEVAETFSTYVWDEKRMKNALSRSLAVQ